MDIILSMATAFTCPFEGITPVENVLRIIRRGVQLGIHKFCLADTIGQADPKMVRDTIAIVKKYSLMNTLKSTSTIPVIWV